MASIPESKRKLIEERVEQFAIEEGADSGEKYSYAEGAEWMALQDMAEIEQLQTRLKLADEYAANNGLAYNNCLKRIEIIDAKLTAKDALLREAIEVITDSAETIQSEFCSHRDKCSPDVEVCYIKKQLKLLTKLKAELGEGE